MSKQLFAVGALVVLVSLTACGGSGGDQPAAEPADADTPEAQAFRYRQAVMRVAERKMVMLNRMAREEIPLDEAAFVKATADLAAVAGMLDEGFDTEGIATGSRAMPEIWSNWEDFVQRAEYSESAAQGLAAAAADGGFAAARGLVQSTADTCNACHRTYRQRAE